MIQYDITSKLLIDRGTEEIFRFFLHKKLVSYQLIEPLPQELPSVKRSDFILRVVENTGDVKIVVLEFQTHWKPEVIWNLMEYTLRSRLMYQLPVEPVMFLFKPHPQANEIYEDEQFRFRYNLVKFWEEDGRTILDSDAFVLYPFIPLMAGEDELIIQAEQKLYNSTIAKEDKSDLLTALAIFSGLRNKDLSINLIKRRRDMTIESPVYEWLTKEAAEEGLKKGLIEGFQKGCQEGRQEGREEGLKKGSFIEAQLSLIDILRLRFQFIPDLIASHVCELKSIDQLRELRKQAILVQSLEEFEKLLSR